MVPSSTDGSSTSPTTPTRSSRRSAAGRSTSGSPGRSLTARSVLDLARRHGIRPRKSLGQHFLIDPNIARSIARDVGAGPGQRVLEIGAGLGSLTVALAEAGAEVLAIETDHRVADALEEVVEGLPVRVVRGDAMELDWAELVGEGRWRMASNLPYNVAVPLVMTLLEDAPEVDPVVVMVQREVGERLAASPGAEPYGAVSAKVAYHARVRTLRRLGTKVFWPAPKVDSVVVRLDRRPPPVSVAKPKLFALIESGFAQRRKTLVSGIVRMGVTRDVAIAALRAAGLDERVRAEALGLEDLARVADGIPD